MDERIPLVSILCPTYNHEKFIAQTLEGFLMQKTSFCFEIIVHEDASTDNTASIVKEFENKFPQYFRNIYQIENQFSKSADYVLRTTLSAARGRYLALCEGDDYWIDELKLQKQVEFLEKNPGYSLSFHDVFEWEENKTIRLSNIRTVANADTYTIMDLAKQNFIHTPSVVFRNIFTFGLPNWFAESYVGDYMLYMLSAEKGNIKYFPEPMAVYRRHTGFWSVQSQMTKWQKWFKVLDLLKTHFRDHEVLPVLKKQETEIINEIISITERLEREVQALKTDPNEIAGKVTVRNLISAIRIKAGNLFRNRHKHRSLNTGSE